VPARFRVQCRFILPSVLYFLPMTEKQVHSRKHRVAARRRSAIEDATSTIQAIAEHQIDAYEGWQQVCGIFQRNGGLDLHELKPFVRIEGVDNSTLSVTTELREMICRKAARIFFPSTTVDKSPLHSLAGL